METPTFTTKKELFEWLIENKQTLIAQKKAEMKRGDGVLYLSHSNGIKKAESNGSDGLQVKAVINTTNLMDSHKDVHLPGLWTKSLKENNMIMHLQEHEMKFDKVIAKGDDLNVYTKDFTWKELGYKAEGKTQALVFESTIRKGKQDGDYMLKQYAKGNVDNHSVGMRYVKLVLAVNDEESGGAEFEAWEKYYPEIANKAEADRHGYFWAVKEAQVIEGSAVLLGSNHVTPTLEIEPSKDTQTIEPQLSTQQRFKNDLKTIKFFN